MRKSTHTNSSGFTLVELMIGMAVFLIISGAVLQGLGTMQKSYRSGEMHATMQQRVRGTMELMEQEIGEAGLQASTVEGNNAATTGGAPYTISAVSGQGTFSPGVTTVTGIFNGIYVGQWLQVDGGANQDPIQVTAVNGTVNPPTITALFGNTAGHAAGTVMYPMGVFPHGIMASGLAANIGNAADPADPSTSTKLVLFGDLHGSGNGLYAVEYNCAIPTLTRTEWNLDASSPSTAYTRDTLLNTVTSCAFCWPGNTTTAACPTGAAAPQYVDLQVPAGFGGPCPPGAASGYCRYYMITQVGITITIQDTDTTSGTNQTITMTKSFSNIQPRNIIAANNIFNIASSTAATGVTDGVTGAVYQNYLYGELQPDPTALSSITF